MADRPQRGPNRRRKKPTKKPQRILVVEDDLSIRELSAEVLIRFGYEVDSAADGAAGWETLQAKRYDLLITDHSMPKVTGLEMVKMLRGENSTVPIIMASAAIPVEELNRNPSLRINAILNKPYTITELLGTVREVLRATSSARK
jgi:DNA-binding response OmpR family regulator